MTAATKPARRSRASVSLDGATLFQEATSLMLAKRRSFGTKPGRSPPRSTRPVMCIGSGLEATWNERVLPSAARAAEAVITAETRNSARNGVRTTRGCSFSCGWAGDDDVGPQRLVL